MNRAHRRNSMRLLIVLAVVLLVGVGCRDDEQPEQVAGVDDSGMAGVTDAGSDDGEATADQPPATGLSLRWQSDVGTGSSVAPAVFDDAVVVVTADGRLVVLAAEDGKPHGVVQKHAPIMGVAAARGDAVIVATTREVVCYEIDGLAAKWRTPIAAPVGITVVDAMAVVVTTEGGVWMLDLETGDVRLQTGTEEPVAIAPVVAGPIIGVAHTTGAFSGVAIDGGSVRSLFDLESPAIGFTAVGAERSDGEDSTWFAIRDEAGELHGRARDGAELASPTWLPQVDLGGEEWLSVDLSRIVGFTVGDGSGDAGARFTVAVPGAPPIAVGAGPAGVATAAIDGMVALFEITYD